MINRFLLIKKQYLFLIVALGLLILVLFSALLFRKTTKEVIEVSPSPTTTAFTPTPIPEIGDAKVLGIEPTEQTPLIPGNIQIFNIQLDKPIEDSTFNVQLIEKDLTEDLEDKKIEVKKSIQESIIRIETVLPIQAYSRYTLTITTSRGQQLFSVSYLSDKPVASPAINNNLILADFLPYLTDSYSLRYSADDNLYIFSFKYNEYDLNTLEKQFDKAKASAEKFIKEKGINLNSIKIEWRYH